MEVLAIMRVIILNVMLKIPVCNIITCEDIAVSSENKMYICNPFTGISKRSTRKFYTYTVIQEMPNGEAAFRIEIVSPDGKIIKQTEDNNILVEENLIRVKTQWSNIIFNDTGQYSIRVLIKCNNEFDVIGSSHLYIV